MISGEINSPLRKGGSGEINSPLRRLSHSKAVGAGLPRPQESATHMKSWTIKHIRGFTIFKRLALGYLAILLVVVALGIYTTLRLDHLNQITRSISSIDGETIYHLRAPPVFIEKLPRA